jgi:hypothetical protein
MNFKVLDEISVEELKKIHGTKENVGSFPLQLISSDSGNIFYKTLDYGLLDYRQGTNFHQIEFDKNTNTLYYFVKPCKNF